MSELEPFKRRLSEYKDGLSEDLISGGAKDYVMYAKTVGKIELAQTLLDDISEIEARYIED